MTATKLEVLIRFLASVYIHNVSAAQHFFSHCTISNKKALAFPKLKFGDAGVGKGGLRLHF